MLQHGVEYQIGPILTLMPIGTGKRQIQTVHSIPCKYQMVQPHFIRSLMSMQLTNKSGSMTLYQLWKRCCPMGTQMVNWLMDLISTLELNVPDKVYMMVAITTTAETLMNSVSLFSFISKKLSFESW